MAGTARAKHSNCCDKRERSDNADHDKQDALDDPRACDAVARRTAWESRGESGSGDHPTEHDHHVVRMQGAPIRIGEHGA